MGKVTTFKKINDIEVHPEENFSLIKSQNGIKKEYIRTLHSRTKTELSRQKTSYYW